MKRTKLLTSLSALALVVSLGACDASCIEEVKEFAISFESNGYVYAIDLPASADEGDKVEFKLAAQSGFRIEEVQATYIADSRSQILDLDGDATGYSFVMPAADVSISAKGVGGYYSISYDRNEEVFVTEGYSSYKQLHFIDGIYEQGTGEVIGTDEKTFVQAGTEVMLVGKHQQEAGEPRFFLDGEELEQLTDPELNAGYFAFGFVMPDRDCELKVSVAERHITAVLEENELVDAYLYLADDEDKTPLDSVSDLIIDNDKIYVHAELKSGIDSSRYTGISRVTVGADVYSDYSVLATSYSTKDLSETSTGSGDYSVYVPYWLYTGDEVTISIDVVDELKYDGYDFVGSWTGFEFYPASASYYDNPFEATIGSSGSFAFSSTNTTIESVSEDGNTLYLADGRPFYMDPDNRIGITFYSATSLNVNDTYVFLKTEYGTSYTSITYQYVQIWGSIQYVLEVFVDGTSWGCFYAENQSSTGLGHNLSQDLYAGVTITYDEGYSSLADTNPAFTVTDPTGELNLHIGAEDYEH